MYPCYNMLNLSYTKKSIFSWTTFHYTRSYVINSDKYYIDDTDQFSRQSDTGNHTGSLREMIYYNQPFDHVQILWLIYL